jgi:nicotinamidase/pyrazinamidase
MKTGVIVTDIQGDFTELKRGSLAVKGTDQPFIDKVLAATKILKEKGFAIFVTQDFHPGNHISFFTTYPGKKAFEVISRNGKEQVLWPLHCVQGSKGQRYYLTNNCSMPSYAKARRLSLRVIPGFMTMEATRPLSTTSSRQRISSASLFTALPPTICVHASSLDAVALGYRVVMVKNLSRGVAPETTNHALEEMKQRGVIVIDTLSKEDI